MSLRNITFVLGGALMLLPSCKEGPTAGSGPITEKIIEERITSIDADLKDTILLLSEINDFSKDLNFNNPQLTALERELAAVKKMLAGIDDLSEEKKEGLLAAWRGGMEGLLPQIETLLAQDPMVQDVFGPVLWDLSNS